MSMKKLYLLCILWVVISTAKPWVEIPEPLSIGKMLTSFAPMSDSKNTTPALHKHSGARSDLLADHHRIVHQAPTLEQIRQEAQSNPHATPRSILQFGAQLALQLEPALKDETLAQEFFGQLKHCITPPHSKAPLTVLAICLHNAHLLAQQFPSMRPERDALFAQANPEARRLVTID